jgi:hypothetical protein
MRWGQCAIKPRNNISGLTRCDTVVTFERLTLSSSYSPDRFQPDTTTLENKNYTIAEVSFFAVQQQTGILFVVSGKKLSCCFGLLNWSYPYEIHANIKAYFLIISLVDRWIWVVVFTFRPLYAQKKTPSTPVLWDRADFGAHRNIFKKSEISSYAGNRKIHCTLKIDVRRNVKCFKILV